MFVRNDNTARFNDILAQESAAPVRARYSDNSVTKTVSRFFLTCAAISGIAFLLSGSPIALVSCGASLGLSLFFSAIDSRMRRYRYRPDPSVVVIDNRPPLPNYGSNVLLREAARLEAEQQRINDAALQARILRQQEDERARAFAAAQAQRQRDEAAAAAAARARASQSSAFSRHMPDSASVSRSSSTPRVSAPAQTYTRHMPESQQQAPANPPANQYKRHMPESAKQ
ncbi:MAG: hypothetical protein LLF94_06990 [Chlamydiales bacterium]|nr:hypothetical protein [Chlamydiales bacterium]